MPEYFMPGKDTPAFNKLPAFTRGYIEAALFTLPDEMNQRGFFDIPEDTLAEIIRDCDAFYAANRDHIDVLTSDEAHPDYDEEAAGRDFWYTREGHGVGYWDRGFRGDAEKAAEALDQACKAVGMVNDSTLGLPENDPDDELDDVDQDDGPEV